MASVAWGLNNMIRRLQDSKDRWLLWFKDTTVKVILILLLVTLQLWISIFLYGSFYYAYMPTVAHLKPVFLQFYSTCDRFSGTEVCPFPHTNTTLVKSPHTRLLMKGQKYKVTLDLEMPQSPVNEDLGVFMVKLDFFSYQGETASQSTRPAMIRYRSPVLKLLEVLVYSPLLLAGYAEEKQLLTITLLEDFIDNSYKPVIGAYIELQARKIEVYSSILRIQAHFTGLRYFMYYWPIGSSVVGIGSFFMLLSIFTILSWQQCAASFWKTEPEEVPIRYTQPRAITYEERRSIMKRNMEQERLALFQSRPQHVTVGNSQLESPPKPLRYSQSEPSLLVTEGRCAKSLADTESTGRVETISQTDCGDGTTSELTDATAEKASAEKTKPDQGDRASDSSDEAHGFEKVEKVEEDKNADKEKLEKIQANGSRSSVMSRKELESLSTHKAPDTDLRYRKGHGKEDTQ